MKGKTISLLALFIALSAVGAMVKIPAIVGSVALDAFPALLAGGLLGPAAGAAVGALGHLLSALLSGFPMGPMHLLIAGEMAVLVWVYAILYKRHKKIIASIVFVIGNAFLAPVPFIFLMNMGFYVSLVPSLLVGALINTILGFVLIPRLSLLFQHDVQKKEVHH